LHIGPTLGAVKMARLSTPMLEGLRERLIAGKPGLLLPVS
jgi:hypothetical protein